MKKITPGALVALKEALSVIYHYKRDFETFIKQAVDDPAIVARLNWNDMKRNTASLVVDLLAKNETRHQATLLNRMSAVAAMDDFAHLERLEDGPQKAKTARDAVAALRKLIRRHEDEVREQEKVKARREASERAARKLHLPPQGTARPQP